MDIENVLRTAIQHIGNKKYDEATRVLIDAQNDITGKVPKVPKEEKPKEEVKAKGYTRDELYALNKDDQVDLINGLSSGETKIPRFEKGRVNLILELQEK